MKEALKDIKRLVKELTSDLEQEDYAEFMRNLGSWAISEAELAEYGPEMASIID